MLELFLVSAGLSMDAFAVSVSSAACSPNLKKRYMFRAAFLFGFFQFFMPLVGWFLGSSFSAFIRSVDHFLAFVLLAAVGTKMLVEVYAEWNKNPASCPTGDELKCRDISSKRVVLALAVATSIDALAVGISFSVIGRTAFQPALMIGLVTFIFCLIGFLSGKKLGILFGRGAQIIGGIVLIAIGLKILIEHMVKAI